MTDKREPQKIDDVICTCGSKYKVMESGTFFPRVRVRIPDPNCKHHFPKDGK